MRIGGIVEVLDQLPQLGTGWSSSVQGRRVKVGEKVYHAVNKNDGRNWKAVWEEVSE